MTERHEAIVKSMAMIHRSEHIFKDSRLKETGLCVGQLRYLFTLYKEDGLAQEAFVKRFSVDKANVTRHIKRLLKFGFVRCEQDQKDKRIQRIFLTEKGLAHRSLIEELTEQWNDCLTAGFTEQERADFFRLIVQMAENATHVAKKEEHI
ncbi:MarR family winged helix-turn-helix transcriptional regulator [Listeria valentina]|uniref:MarR family winged helix-turn-helix transcriptional regulator n=1 Tax=Listeria valentina TaxID=2705293 RepID=UPI001430D151|nr:MarR family transcriptional regulator [Listeria valentina]